MKQYLLKIEYVDIQTKEIMPLIEIQRESKDQILDFILEVNNTLNNSKYFKPKYTLFESEIKL